MGREVFETELIKVREMLTRLSTETRKALCQSVNLLKNRDLVKAEELIRYDEEINGMCNQVEETCLNLIATQQPVAGDLRLIFSVMHIATEMERIADYAKGICRITIKLGSDQLIKPLIDIPRMAEVANGMLEDVIRAFHENDEKAARKIPARDVEIDLLYDQIHRELLTFIMSDMTKIEGAMMLIFIAHNLERTGDRIVNICERIIFTVTGEVVDLD